MPARELHIAAADIQRFEVASHEVIRRETSPIEYAPDRERTEIHYRLMLVSKNAGPLAVEVFGDEAQAQARKKLVEEVLA